MSPVRLVLTWAIGIVAVEWLVLPGAATWRDAVGVPVVLILVGLTKWSVVRATLVVPAGARALRRWLTRACWVEYGVDLRRVPPIARRVPRVQIAIILLTCAVGTGALLVPAEAPGGIRAVLVPGASFVYAAGLTLAWSWAAAISAVGLFAVWYAVSDTLLVDGPPSRRENRIRVGLPFVVIAGAVLAATELPPIAPTFLLATILALSAVALPLRSLGAIELLWRKRARYDVFAVGSRWFYTWRTFMHVGVPLVTVLVMTRSAWAGGPASPSAWIGSATGWLSAVGGLGWLWIGPLRLLRLGSNDHVGERPTPLRFVGRAPGPDVVGALAARGFRVVEGAADPAVEVALDPRTLEPGGGTDRGALELAADELLGARALAELRAADRRARRREVIEAFNRLMRVATRMTFAEGSGFWFAPHIWYMWGMSRDTDETDVITVGPPYHRVLSADARSHCLEVFQATAVDLVFIQDGVIAASAERVLTQLFDHFDVWGVHPIEERHFRHMPGIRILIHDFEHGAPLAREGYREPDYESIGRARILHVMIDRSGDDDDAPDVDAPTREPMGVGMSR